MARCCPSGPTLYEIYEIAKGAYTLKQWARLPDALVVDVIARDGNGAALSASVIWPDGTPGEFTADTLSVIVLGAVDGYHITYEGTPVKTYTQPAVARNVLGVIIDYPEIVVS